MDREKSLFEENTEDTKIRVQENAECSNSKFKEKLNRRTNRVVCATLKAAYLKVKQRIF